MWSCATSWPTAIPGNFIRSTPKAVKSWVYRLTRQSPACPRALTWPSSSYPPSPRFKQSENAPLKASSQLFSPPVAFPRSTGKERSYRRRLPKPLLKPGFASLAPIPQGTLPPHTISPRVFSLSVRFPGEISPTLPRRGTSPPIPCAILSPGKTLVSPGLPDSATK
ncbi:hypothetical protein ES703_89320 [subsurface metagenome]